ncbi:MAG: FAD:protein FMN transferase [Solirubrobacteraceae bacterium]
MTEAGDTFACFGAKAGVRVLGDAEEATAAQAVRDARDTLLDLHARFTRFDPGSELSRLNADPRESVRVSTMMALFAEAVVSVAAYTGGLVDATLLGAIERAGYRSDLRGSVPLPLAIGLAPPRRPARPRPSAAWEAIGVDRLTHTITRPPGVGLDSGGLAKGLFADVLGEHLAGHASFAVDCAGDLLLGGRDGIVRRIDVADPFGGPVRHTFPLASGGVATSGIGRRSWLDADGRPAHHLLDPSTGRPAFTGIVQVTAIAPTALEAEVRSKAALLSGPERAEAWLPDGGVVVFDDASHVVVAAAASSAAA